MILSKALLNFAKLNDSQLDTRANAVVTAMTDNANFPDVGSTLTDLKAASDAYALALATAKVGTPSQVAEKNDRKAELVVALKAMGDYVNYMAGGDRVMLLTTGFEVSKDSRTPVVIEPIENLMVDYGSNSGTLDLSIKKGAGVRSVVFQYSLAETVDNNTAWISSTCTESKCTIDNLPVGKMVWIRAGVVGPRRQSIFSQPVQKMVA